MIFYDDDDYDEFLDEYLLTFNYDNWLTLSRYVPVQVTTLPPSNEVECNPSPVKIKKESSSQETGISRRKEV